MADMDPEENREKLSLGRLWAVKKAPYFRKGLFAMIPTPMEGLGTFATDEHWRMYYDPQMVEEWTVSEIGAVWLHELGHLVRHHAQRFKDTGESLHYARLWNVAGDAGINTDLKEMDVLLPSPDSRYYSTRQHYPGWAQGSTTEQLYYQAKDAECPEDDEQGESSGQGESGDESQDGSEDSSGEQSGEDSQESAEGSQDGTEGSSEAEDEEESQEGEGNAQGGAEGSSQEDSGGDEGEAGSSGGSGGDESDEEGDVGGESGGQAGGSGGLGKDEESTPGGSGEPQEGQGGESPEGESSGGSQGDSDGPPDFSHLPDCGSGTDGNPREYDLGEDSSDGSLDSTDAKTIREQVAQDIVDYDKGNPGQVPGGMVRDAIFVLNPQNDWRKEFSSSLRRIVASWSGNNVTSYTRISRRPIPKVVMPGKVAFRPPTVAVVLDTSGSMSQKDLGYVLGEVRSMLKRLRAVSPMPSIKVINCDVMTTAVTEITNADDIDLFGGGGTDMRIGIEAAAHLSPVPDIIITATDGYTPFPKEPVAPAIRTKYLTLLVVNELVTENTRAKWNLPEFMKTIFISTKL